jgi:hypothetical protein
MLVGEELLARIHTELWKGTGGLQPSGNAGGYWVVFLFERRIIVYRSARAEQAQQSPHNNHLLEFLTFLDKKEASPTPRLSIADVR